MGLFHSLRPNLRSFEIIKLLQHKVMFLLSRALPLQYSPRSQTSPNTFPTLLSILPFPPTVHCFLPVSHGLEKMYRNPLPPGASGTPVEPKETSGTLLPSLYPLCRVSKGLKPGAGREMCSLLVSIALSHPFPGHSDPIGRSPGIAASKTDPATGTASIDATE